MPRIETLALLAALSCAVGCAREGEPVPQSAAEAPAVAAGRLETATFALG